MKKSLTITTPPRKMSTKRFSKQVSVYEDGKKKELGVLSTGPKSYGEILVYLENEIKKSKQMTAFQFKISCFKEDGAYQLNKAIEEIYGASINKGEDTPSNGEQPVEMLDVKLNNGDRIKVPFGKIATPEFGPDSHINIGYKEDTNILYIEGKCQFQYQSMMDSIVNRTEQLLNTESIYKNQAFELDKDFKPKALDLSKIDDEFMILSEQTEIDLLPIKSRILHPDFCRKRGIPLKYGVLLEGIYGTGKTLLAFKLALEAIGNNWSFIYLKDPSLLARTLRLAKSLDNCGNGVIVFVEDIDQVTRGDRDTAMQDILNTMDGGDTKNMNVISIFTTNHIELIEPTFLRGKRIGSIISLTYLDAKTAEEFLKFSFKEPDYTLEMEGIADVCTYIEESKIAPAFMAEIVDTVKSKIIFTGDNVVKAKYVRGAVAGYLRQVGLSAKKDMSQSNAQKLEESLRVAVGAEYKERLDEIEKQLKELNEYHS